MAGMMVPAAWTLGYAGLMFVMWWTMMAAMMLPSAAPILLLFARVNRNQKAGGRPFVPAGIFAAGYLVAWGGFSALATVLQWELEQLGLLSPMMATTSYWLGSAILLAAGVWQLTPPSRLSAYDIAARPWASSSRAGGRVVVAPSEWGSSMEAIA